MTTLQIALCQVPVSEGDAPQNRERVLRLVEQHGEANDLLLFPETCLSGFSRRDEVFAAAEPLDGPMVAALQKLCARFDTSVLLGMAELADDGLYNTAALVGPQGLVGAYRKTQLWLADRAIFRAGDRWSVFAWRGLTVGLLICFDIEYPEPARALAAMGADLILVVNGNMHPFGPVHVLACCARAQENQVFVAMVNRVGQGRDELFVGESMVVGPGGEQLLRMDRREGVGSIRIDTAEIALSRRRYTYLRERRIPLAPEAASAAQDARQVLLAPERL